MMRIIFLIILVVVAGGFGYVFFGAKDEGAKTFKEETIQGQDQLESVDFSKLSATFRFSAKIPAEFAVEYIPQVKAVSVYDPRLPGDNVREKSQIYISSFEANRFLTLGTVEIIQQDETLTNGHDAVLYEITKKAGVPNFTKQPSWRNSKHKALDVRFTRDNPSVFYSFAYNPELPQTLFDQFIGSLEFHEN